MSRLISFPLLLLLLLISQSRGQSLSTSVYLPDWGLSDVQSITMAQFSVVYAKNDERLEVRALYDEGVFKTADPVSADRLEVAGFNEGFVNLLGGSYASYGGNGGTAEARHFLANERTVALDVTYDRTKGGYCGLWMHLFNSAAPLSARRYLDATPYEYISVAIRGNQGNEKVVFKIADEEWNKKEDAFLVGDINRYIPGGRIETEWQTAVIPLKVIPTRINVKRLAGMTFEAFAPASGSFQLGPISFLRSFPTGPTIAERQSKIRPQPIGNAIWMWNTELLIAKPERDRFLDLLGKEKITDVFLALPYNSARGDVSLDWNILSPVVRTLNAAGVKVHALIGDKDFILPDRRSSVRRMIQNIVDYNKAVGLDARFHAIHLDVEPYLLPGFASPRQSWFLQNFLETLAECSRIARAGNTPIGADIPFWFDGFSELTHLPMAATLNGITKPVYQHVLDLMDNIALMDYRTPINRENQIFLFAANELAYADEAGKDVFVGLETAPLPDETIVTFKTPPQRGIPKPAPRRQYMILAQKQNRFVSAVVSTGDEISNFIDRNRVERQEVFFWPIERVTKVPGSLLSFATLGVKRLRSAMATTQFALRMYKSFAGFAIHHYGSFVQLK